MKNKIKKECLIISIIFLFIGLSASSSGVNIKNINTINPNICHNGTILYVGGSGEDNYTRIQYAINDANPGDIVFVYDDSSPYYERIVINKSINLIGEDKNDTVIDGNKKGKVVYISADRVNITGFTIRNSGIGIKAVSDHNTIYGNILTQHENCIVLDWSSNNNVFKNDVISNTGFGIFLYQAQNNIIRDNQIKNCNDFGIYLFVKSKNNLVSGNIINSCSDGIFTDDTSSNIYSNNTITDCKVGFTGKRTNYNTISGNYISNNDWWGIKLADFSDSIITKNIITKNNHAIDMGGSSRNMITYNIIKNNLKGLYLWYCSDDNEIFYNTFMKNFRNVFFEDSSNNWYQNFWSRTRYLPKLIIGGKTIQSLVYLMPWFEIDWHPAKEPFDIKV